MVPGGAVEKVGDSGVNVGNDLGSVGSQEPGDVALGAKGDAEDLQAVMSIYLLPLDARGQTKILRWNRAFLCTAALVQICAVLTDYLVRKKTNAFANRYK